jgi:hypothetical protein
MLILISVLLISCSSENSIDKIYNEKIQLGQDAFANNDFNSAITYFTYAKKINPTV